MIIDTLPLPLILRTQSAIAWGCGGELWRLHSSGRAHRATRRGCPLTDGAWRQGKKVSAVQGLAPDGTRPEMMSCRRRAWPGSSQASGAVTAARTYVLEWGWEGGMRGRDCGKGRDKKQTKQTNEKHPAVCEKTSHRHRPAKKVSTNRSTNQRNVETPKNTSATNQQTNKLIN